MIDALKKHCLYTLCFLSQDRRLRQQKHLILLFLNGSFASGSAAVTAVRMLFYLNAFFDKVRFSILSFSPANPFF